MPPRRWHGVAPAQPACRRDPGVSRPIRGNVRRDLSYGSEYCLLISLATRLRKSKVLHESEHSTGKKYVSGLLPANLRVNPVKRGRRENSRKLFAGKQCILKLSVHKFHLPSTFQVPPGQCYEVWPGSTAVTCRPRATSPDLRTTSPLEPHPPNPASTTRFSMGAPRIFCWVQREPSRETQPVKPSLAQPQAACQLAAATSDLKHMITAPDPCDLASLVDEFVRISRTAAVVLSRDLIKNLA